MNCYVRFAVQAMAACGVLMTAACGPSASSPTANSTGTPGASTPSASATPLATPTPAKALYTAASTPTGGGVIPGGQWIAVSGSNGSVMLAQVFTPPGAGPFPAVLVLHGTEGFAQHHTQLAQYLSQHGYVGVAACWFAGNFNGAVRPPNPPQTPPAENSPVGVNCPQAPPLVALPGAATWPEAVTTINGLIAAIRTLPSVKSNEIGLVGHSRGAIAALTVAAQGASVQAIVAADGTPANGLAPQEVGSILLIEGLADHTMHPQTVMSFEAALKAAGKSVQDDYVARAPHPLIWNPPWQAPAQARMLAFFQQVLP